MTRCRSLLTFLAVWFICLLNHACAEAQFSFLGFCKGGDIPPNYYTTTHSLYHNIGQDKLYACFRATNTSPDTVLTIRCDDVTQDPPPPPKGYINMHCIPIFADNRLNPGESYCFFIKCETSVAGSLPTRLKGKLRRATSKGQELPDKAFEIPITHHNMLSFPGIRQETLQTTLLLVNPETREYSIRHECKGQQAATFLINKYERTPVAAVCRKDGINATMIGYYGYYPGFSYIQQVSILPGDVVISTSAPIITETQTEDDETYYTEDSFLFPGQPHPYFLITQGLGFFQLIPPTPNEEDPPRLDIEEIPQL